MKCSYKLRGFRGGRDPNLCVICPDILVFPVGCSGFYPDTGVTDLPRLGRLIIFEVQPLGLVHPELGSQPSYLSIEGDEHFLICNQQDPVFLQPLTPHQLFIISHRVSMGLRITHPIPSHPIPSHPIPSHPNILTVTIFFLYMKHLIHCQSVCILFHQKSFYNWATTYASGCLSSICHQWWVLMGSWIVILLCAFSDYSQ